MVPIDSSESLTSIPATDSNVFSTSASGPAGMSKRRCCGSWAAPMPPNAPGLKRWPLNSDRRSTVATTDSRPPAVWLRRDSISDAAAGVLKVADATRAPTAIHGVAVRAPDGRVDAAASPDCGVSYEGPYESWTRLLR